MSVEILVLDSDCRFFDIFAHLFKRDNSSFNILVDVIEDDFASLVVDAGRAGDTTLIERLEVRHFQCCDPDYDNTKDENPTSQSYKTNVYYIMLVFF